MASTGSVTVSQEYKAVSQKTSLDNHYYLHSNSTTKTLLSCNKLIWILPSIGYSRLSTDFVFNCGVFEITLLVF